MLSSLFHDMEDLCVDNEYIGLKFTVMWIMQYTRGDVSMYSGSIGTKEYIFSTAQ